MKGERIGLSQRHKVWVYASFGAVFVSGAAWIGAQLWQMDGGPFGQSPSPLARWSMEVHGAAAMLVLVVLGTLLSGHVQRAWRTGKSRQTGVLVIGVNVLLIATGYALYYAGGERLRAIASPLHWVAGLGLPVLLGWHVWEGASRRVKVARARRVRAPGSSAPPLHQGAASDALPPPGQPLH